MFELHPQLKENLRFLGPLDLSKVFLMPDSDVPWIVLVPQIPDLKEWHQLNEGDQFKLQKEMNLVSVILEAEYKPDKINIAALGNIVPQFHLHIIGRYVSDRAWPAPIWGTTLGTNQDVIDEREKFFKKKLFLN